MAVADWSNLLYPNSNVLINKAGLKDKDKLESFERMASTQRTSELKLNPIQGQYDLAHMQAIHARIFQDVYEWAGKVRTFDLQKGSTIFTFAENIPTKASDIQKTIKDEKFLRGTNKDEFTTKLSEIYKEVNILHPFREGNGRTTRVYIEQLADGAGYKLDYSKVGAVEWNNAAKESVSGNLKPMKAVFEEISTPKRAIAFDKLSQPAALALNPELDGAFKLVIDARLNGKDVEAVKREVSKQLHMGKIVDGGVTNDESAKVIAFSAKQQGLTTHTPGSLGTKYTGYIVAQSSHHVLFKTDDKNAIVYAKKELHPNINIQVGEKLNLQHQEYKQDKIRGISESKGFEQSKSR